MTIGTEQDALGGLAAHRFPRKIDDAGSDFELSHTTRVVKIKYLWWIFPVTFYATSTGKTDKFSLALH